MNETPELRLLRTFATPIPEFHMTNTGPKIVEGTEEWLKADANRSTEHFAHEFHGTVWYEPSSGLFVEEVRRYKRVIDTVRASSLDELMEKVNNLYGWA